MADENVRIGDGLGLWPEVIVDQHFLKRQRFNRLLSAVRLHPDRIGVGIDEETAVVVGGGTWRVIGAGQVVILEPTSDARRFTLTLLYPSEAWSPPKAAEAATETRNRNDE